jgi:hypothetical protein
MIMTDADRKEHHGTVQALFYSFDCTEPMHIHVQREKMTCKFWLEPVALGRNNGFASKELNTIREMVYNNRDKLAEAWHEHCGEASGS